MIGETRRAFLLKGQSLNQPITAVAEADRYETRGERPVTCTTVCPGDLVIKRPKAG